MTPKEKRLFKELLQAELTTLKHDLKVVKGMLKQVLKAKKASDVLTERSNNLNS